MKDYTFNDKLLQTDRLGKKSNWLFVGRIKQNLINFYKINLEKRL